VLIEALPPRPSIVSIDEINPKTLLKQLVPPGMAMVALADDIDVLP
jgi:hypothetical protein